MCRLLTWWFRAPTAVYFFILITADIIPLKTLWNSSTSNYNPLHKALWDRPFSSLDSLRKLLWDNASKILKCLLFHQDSLEHTILRSLGGLLSSRKCPQFSSFWNLNKEFYSFIVDFNFTPKHFTILPLILATRSFLTSRIFFAVLREIILCPHYFLKILLKNWTVPLIVFIFSWL